MTEHFRVPGITAHQRTYGIAMTEDFLRIAYRDKVITHKQLLKLRAMLEQMYPTPTYNEMDVERVVLDIVMGEQR